VEGWIASWQQLARGELVPVLFVLGGYVVCTAIEHVVPARPGQGWSGRFRNLTYLALYDVCGIAALATWYALRPTSGTHHVAADPINPLWLLPAHLLAIDFAYYWYHRAQHRFSFLWAVHELHHADAELNVTTSYRAHWLEAPLQAILVAGPVTLLWAGPDPRVGFMILIGSRFFFLFSHCNFRLPLGPFTGVLVGPHWHRIHHSSVPRHRDKNFAQIFPVLDWLFGTYYAPARDEFPPTGTEGLASDAPVWRAQIQPLFIWRDGVRAWFTRSA
jgi:sterol desaturase/sphingolipid hydroxylase (fatty acid hydroxylase superfamily)